MPGPSSGMTVLGTSADVAPVVDAAHRRGVPLTRVDADLVDRAALAGAEVVLVRPDQQIASLGAVLSSAEADASFDAVLTDGPFEPAGQQWVGGPVPPLPRSAAPPSRSAVVRTT